MSPKKVTEVALPEESAMVRVKDLPIDTIQISAAQVRTRKIDTGLDDLAVSIRTVGILQPILVTVQKGGEYELIAGQRRFLAAQKAGLTRVPAVILPGHASPASATAISLTENLMREPLDARDMIDACSALYKKYGTIQSVSSETGLPNYRVREFVKYDRLHDKLKSMVDTGEVDVSVALQAQDLLSPQEAGGNIGAVTELAAEMSGWTGAARAAVLRAHQREPETPVSELVKTIGEVDKPSQLVVTLTRGTLRALQKFAKNELLNQSEAASKLIEECLIDQGFLK